MLPPLFWLNLSALAVAGAAFALLALALHLQERKVSRYVAHRLGWRAVLVTAWIGVPLHELSHFVVAKLFGHRVIAVKLFDPDPVSGTLGYIRHAYRHPTLWQRSGYFFIGIAPLVFGMAALGALVAWLAGGFEPLIEIAKRWPRAASVEQLWGAIPALGEAARNLIALIWTRREPYWAFQLYLGVCIASHMAPSRADLGTALAGIASLAALLIGGAGVGVLGGWSFSSIVHVATMLPLLLLLVGAWQLLLVGAVASIERLRRGRRRSLDLRRAQP